MDETVGVVVAARGRLILVLAFTVRDSRIAGYDVIADQTPGWQRHAGERNG